MILLFCLYFCGLVFTAAGGGRGGGGGGGGRGGGGRGGGGRGGTTGGGRTGGAGAGRTSSYPSRVTINTYHGPTLVYFPRFYGTNHAHYERSGVSPRPCIVATSIFNISMELWLGQTCPLTTMQQGCIDDVYQTFLEPGAPSLKCSGNGKFLNFTSTKSLQSVLFPLDWRIVIRNNFSECLPISLYLEKGLDGLVKCENERSGIDTILIGILVVILVAICLLGCVCFWICFAGKKDQPIPEEEQYLLGACENRQTQNSYQY